MSLDVPIGWLIRILPHSIFLFVFTTTPTSAPSFFAYVHRKQSSTFNLLVEYIKENAFVCLWLSSSYYFHSHWLFRSLNSLKTLSSKSTSQVIEMLMPYVAYIFEIKTDHIKTNAIFNQKEKAKG